MSKTLVFTVVGLILSLYCSTITSQESRIVGGTASTISQLKYLVYIRLDGSFICGGTLITNQHVVTAAHCVKGIKVARLQVVGGATYLTDTGVRRNVKKMILPTAYNSDTLNKDVAVLKLASKMTGTNISPIGLCNSAWKVGDSIQVSGWGLTSSSASNVPNRVRTVEVSLIAKSACATSYSGQATLTNSMFCAAELGEKDACSGDSGGPAVYNGQLCGIVSWGIGCATNEYPGVYTNVKVVKSFIQKALTL